MDEEFAGPDFVRLGGAKVNKGGGEERQAHGADHAWQAAAFAFFGDGDGGGDGEGGKADGNEGQTAAVQAGLGAGQFRHVEYDRYGGESIAGEEDCGKSPVKGNVEKDCGEDAECAEGECGHEIGDGSGGHGEGDEGAEVPDEGEAGGDDTKT